MVKRLKTKERFTKGWWTSYDWGADWWVGTEKDDSGPLLRVGSIHADREANAHLIGAAPNLYWASKHALALIEEHLPHETAPEVKEVADELRKALVKALNG